MATRVCPQCGTARVGELRFCANCGLDLEAVREARAAQAIPAEPSEAPPTGADGSGVAEAPLKSRLTLTELGLIAAAGILVVLIAVVIIVSLQGDAHDSIAIGGSPSPESSGAPQSARGLSTAASTPTSSEAPPPGGPRWVTYDLFILAANDRQIAGIDDLEAAIVAHDSAAEARATASLRSYIQEDLAWLREHPPDECYAEHWQLQIQGLEHFQEAMDAYKRWLQLGQEADHQTFLAGLKAASEAIRQTQSLPGAGELCNPIFSGVARVVWRRSALATTTSRSSTRTGGRATASPNRDQGKRCSRSRSSWKPSSLANRSYSAPDC